MNDSAPKTTLLVSGLSGAGKTTALKTLEDMGWEVVDNLPLVLLDRLLDRRRPRDPQQRTPPLDRLPPSRLLHLSTLGQQRSELEL